MGNEREPRERSAPRGSAARTISGVHDGIMAKALNDARNVPSRIGKTAVRG
jgi:hypothetical protein